MVNKPRIIFHVDVNSAYLSWTAIKLLEYGEILEDIRNIPSVIGGNEEERHGIILAKSIPAKKYNIRTGESIRDALKKYPDLKIYPPDYKQYILCSDSMFQLLSEYSPIIQRYSIDEVFMEMSHYSDNYLDIANEIKNRIEKELGFTVNVGIGNNKLLAKMASDFSKKNSIHTLFEYEIESKMWPLPVEDLFMVGRATREKLKTLNIETIGDLANYNYSILKSKFKSYADILYNYSNGIDSSPVRKKNYLDIKGIGNSTTLSEDINEREKAINILLSLTETAAARLRRNDKVCSVVVVSIRNSGFITQSHQKSLGFLTDSTDEIYKNIKIVFDEIWNGESLRQVGVRLTKLYPNDFCQISLFQEKIDKEISLDKTLDTIRERFGKNSIVRSTFIKSDIMPFIGGTGDEDDYPMMGSIL